MHNDYVAAVKAADPSAKFVSSSMLYILDFDTSAPDKYMQQYLTLVSKMLVASYHCLAFKQQPPPYLLILPSL